MSILLFGTGMIFPWGLPRLGWAHLGPDASWRKIVLEILALAAWNDVHFWVNHRRCTPSRCAVSICRIAARW